MGERLRQARKAAGKTQFEVASALGIAESTYCCYETGKRRPDAVKLSRLAGILGVSGEYLLGRTDDPTPIRFETDNETQREQSLLGLFRLMDDDAKAALLKVAESLAK